MAIRGHQLKGAELEKDNRVNVLKAFSFCWFFLSSLEQRLEMEAKTEKG
jgi:hypothetical protein